MCYLEYLKKSRDRIQTVKNLKNMKSGAAAAGAVMKFKKAGKKSPTNPSSATNGAEPEQQVSVGTENPTYTNVVLLEDAVETDAAA